MKRKSKKKNPCEWEIRNEAARAAWDHTGAGKHGGSTKEKNKRDRRKAKADARDYWAR